MFKIFYFCASVTLGNTRASFLVHGYFIVIHCFFLFTILGKTPHCFIRQLKLLVDRPTSLYCILSSGVVMSTDSSFPRGRCSNFSKSVEKNLGGGLIFIHFRHIVYFTFSIFVLVKTPTLTKSAAGESCFSILSDQKC